MINARSGEFLKMELDARKLSQSRLARHLEIPAQRVNGIING